MQLVFWESIKWNWKGGLKLQTIPSNFYNVHCNLCWRENGSDSLTWSSWNYSHSTQWWGPGAVCREKKEIILPNMKIHSFPGYNVRCFPIKWYGISTQTTSLWLVIKEHHRSAVLYTKGWNKFREKIKSSVVFWGKCRFIC